MPGEDIYSWSTVAADNGSADTLINWVEGQARASVNNSSRSEMAAHAKNRNLLNGSIVTTGTANEQAFLSGNSYTTVPTGMVVKLKIGSGLTNDASATLNMDGIGNTLIVDTGGDALRGSELVGNCYTDFLYNGTNWVFLYSQEFLINLINGGGGVIINKQIFSTAGSFTYTPTPGTECVIIECIAGGGGGGGVVGAIDLGLVAGGGGSGGYSRSYVNAAAIGASQPVTVGALGLPGLGAQFGGSGGTSSVGTLCVANGGAGGQYANPGTTTGSPGGAGGAPGTGDIAAAGNAGGGGMWTSGVSVYAADVTSIGNGGASAFGGAVAGPGGNSHGVYGRNYGAGGSGAASHNGNLPSGNGGGGSSGIVIIVEFAGRGAPGSDGADGAPGPIGPAGPSGPGTGDVLRAGTPTAGQMAQWVDASHIQGVDATAAIAATAITAINVQKFTASGTYTPTSGMKFCIIECVGGGGGGGAAAGNDNQIFTGGGGGSGGYSRLRATAASIGASKAVTIGTGGTGGAAGLNNGTAGTASSVGALCVANGGAGGIYANPLQNGAPGDGGTVGVGDIAAGGNHGEGGFWNIANNAIVQFCGAGGSSIFGGGAPPTRTGAGANGTNYGGGGAGAITVFSSTYHGGDGSAGIVIITEYI